MLTIENLYDIISTVRDVGVLAVWGRMLSLNGAFSFIDHENRFCLQAYAGVAQLVEQLIRNQ